MPRIGDAPSGEDTTADGTEKLPVTGSKYMLVSTIAAYIRTLTQTLTNKTIDLASNTLTGTKAQFNTAMSDADFATLTGTETLTNKTLTAPTIADFTNMAHDHGDADDGGTALASPTITTPTISGAIVFPDNVTQTFNPGADNAGINVGSMAGDPATPDNGDIWYDSTSNELTARIAGANVVIGTSGSAAVATDTIWDAKGDLAGGTGANTAARLAVGTNGHVLTADSAEATGLKWAAASGGGGLVLLEQYTASASATLDFTTFISATYDDYLIEAVELIPATDNVDFQMLFGTGGGPTYDTTAANYYWSINAYSTSATAIQEAGAGSVGYMKLLKTVPNDAGFGVGTFSIRLSGLQSTANVKYYHGTTIFHNGAAFGQGTIGGGWINYATAVTALRFKASSGNITSGTIRAYGIVKT